MTSNVASFLIVFCMFVVATLISFGSNLHFVLLVARVCGEILIVLSILFVFAHRIIGFFLGYYIRSLLDPQAAGIFGFHFDWISLRVGLDSNMLVLHGFEWRNPPEFTNTPYFIRIEEIGFQIDAMTVYDAIMRGGSIKVRHLKLDGVELYIEKLSERSINRAQANGLLKNSIGKDASVPVQSADRPSARTDRSESRSERPVSPVPASPGGTAATTAATTPVQPAAPLKPGVLNLWACMGGTGTEAATEKLDVLSTLKNMGHSITSTFRKTFGVKRRTKSNASTSSAAAGGSDADNADSDNDPEDGEPPSMEEAMARLQAEYPGLVLPPLPTEAFDKDDIQHFTEVQQQQAKETRREAKAREQREKDAWKGWGVPYLLEVDQLYVHDIRLHASDFLNAKHTKEDKGSVIKLKSFTMFRDELTLSPDKKVSKYRRGVYLDDLVWRLVNKLVKELLLNNSIAMMMILTSAVATNTTSLASSGTASSAKLLNQAAATTTSTAKFALNAVGSVFGAAAATASATATAAASTSGGTLSSSASTVSSVTASATQGASNATQSAMKVLSSTSANVSESARSVVNSINPFMKRAASTKQN